MSGLLLPSHPHPLPDESVTSWFIRLAQANGTTLKTLLRYRIHRQGYHMGLDHDIGMPLKLVQNISDATGCTLKEIENITLNKYYDWIFPAGSVNDVSNWTLPIGGCTFPEGQLSSYPVCSKCLGEDLVPYFRKTWRLKFFCFAQYTE